MRFEVTETGVCRRRIAIEVEPEVVEGRIAELVREYRRTRTVPGFRPGKATDSLIRRRYGGQIRSEVLRALIPEVWNQALDEHKLRPVDEPQLEPVDSKPGEALKITGEVDVRPQVDVRDYKGIAVTREVHKITDEQVKQHIELIRHQHADEVPVDRPAQKGDMVVATIQHLDRTGVPLVGKREEGRRWELGGIGALSRDMDEQLVGIAKGERRTPVFHYRDDLHDEPRRGQEDRAWVTVTDIHERHLPELDEKFLKELGEFKTVDDLHKAIREDLEHRARIVARRQVHEQLRDHVIRENQFEVPGSLVERALANMLAEHRERGDDHDEQQFREEHRADAVKGVRGVLALERIAEQENITISDQEVDERVAAMAAGMRVDGDGLRRYMTGTGRYESLRSELLVGKALDYLEEQAKVKEVTVESDADPGTSVRVVRP